MFSVINTSLKCMQPILVLKSYMKLFNFVIIIKMLETVSSCPTKNLI